MSRRRLRPRWQYAPEWAIFAWQREVLQTNAESRGSRIADESDERVADHHLFGLSARGRFEHRARGIDEQQEVDRDRLRGLHLFGANRRITEQNARVGAAVPRTNDDGAALERRRRAVHAATVDLTRARIAARYGGENEDTASDRHRSPHDRLPTPMAAMDPF
jgi:hypothetical protein